MCDQQYFEETLPLPLVSILSSFSDASTEATETSALTWRPL